MSASVSVRSGEPLTVAGNHDPRRVRDSIGPWIIKQPERWLGIAEQRMDAAYVSACFGLAGATIGGLTSFTTTWLTQRAQAREKREESTSASRQAIFNDFIVEASRLYGDALSHQKDDVCDLVQLYAIVGKMRLWASSPVVLAAQQAMDIIITAYLEPNRSLHEIRAMAQEGKMNFLLDFGQKCRAELSQKWR